MFLPISSSSSYSKVTLSSLKLISNWLDSVVIVVGSSSLISSNGSDSVVVVEVVVQRFFLDFFNLFGFGEGAENYIKMI